MYVMVYVQSLADHQPLMIMSHEDLLLQCMDQPGKVANPGRGQAEQEKIIFLYTCWSGADNLVSRDGFGRPVPRQPVHSPHSG